MESTRDSPSVLPTHTVPSPLGPLLRFLHVRSLHGRVIYVGRNSFASSASLPECYTLSWPWDSVKAYISLARDQNFKHILVFIFFLTSQHKPFSLGKHISNVLSKGGPKSLFILFCTWCGSYGCQWVITWNFRVLQPAMAPVCFFQQTEFVASIWCMLD